MERVARLIDGKHLGTDRVVAIYVVDGLIVDPGPETCLETLLAGLDGEEPRGLLLTHIHLDHAGASGALVERFPDLTVYVHERGAQHLADPSKLLKSASRLYGDDMERLWGRVVPVPEANIVALSGGERIEGFRVQYVPGHASHHVAYLHESSGDAYVGDVGGVQIPPAEFTLAPTPPPDIDVEAWLESLDKVEAWSPDALCLTHFGRQEDVGNHVDTVRRQLRRQAERVREGDEATFVAELRSQARAAAGEDVAARYEQAAPPEQLYAGLARYWSKVAA